MKYLILLTVCTIMLTTACSSGPFEVDEDQIQSSVTDEELSILNTSDQPIYYAVFDAEILPLINWAAISTEENKLSGFSSKTFQLSNLFTGDKKTGTVVFFYWEEQDPKTEELKSIAIMVE